MEKVFLQEQKDCRRHVVGGKGKREHNSGGERKNYDQIFAFQMLAPLAGMSPVRRSF